MIVKIDKSFAKDVEKINSSSINKKISRIILGIQKASKVSEISNLKKLHGTKNYYRIRMSDYRIGIIIFKEDVQLVRLLHRKDVYKYFP